MSKIIIILIILILVIAFLIWQPWNIKDMSGWKAYKNKQYGFEIKYPENWVKEKTKNDYIKFFIPEKVANLGPNELTIRIYQKPDRTSLDEWIKKLKEIKSEAEIQGKISEIKPYTVNNTDFYLIDLTNFMGGNILANAFIERNNFVIRIEKDILSQKDRETFKQILSTFRFIN